MLTDKEANSMTGMKKNIYNETKMSNAGLSLVQMQCEPFP